MTRNEMLQNYGNRVRLRVCGILVEDNSLLLVKHKNLGKQGTLWAPPGGGVEFGEPVTDSLQREFKEETNLDVEICDFLFVYEFLEHPLHAVELFYEVKFKSGILEAGYDPEFEKDKQIIEEVKMVNFDEIKNMNPHQLHQILTKYNSVNELLSTSGFFKFENNI